MVASRIEQTELLENHNEFIGEGSPIDIKRKIIEVTNVDNRDLFLLIFNQLNPFSFSKYHFSVSKSTKYPETESPNPIRGSIDWELREI